MVKFSRPNRDGICCLILDDATGTKMTRMIDEYDNCFQPCVETLQYVGEHDVG